MRMTRYLGVVIMLLFISAIFATAGDSQRMSIQVKKGLLRSKPSFLGTVMAKTAYGDRVTVIETKGPWKKVVGKNKKQKGWIHQSALTPKTIKLKAGAKDVKLAASSDELALAGKGFNEDVEKEFKARNKKITFAWVNKMEKMNVSQKSMRKFIKNGGLAPKEAAK